MYTTCFPCSDKQIWDALQKQARPSPWSDECIRDIHDGNQYRQHYEFVSQSPGNLTLLANTDGVQLFKSSKVSMWPIWLVINELPPALR